MWVVTPRYEQLITALVHQRDVVRALEENPETKHGSNDADGEEAGGFAWLAQLRSVQ